MRDLTDRAGPGSAWSPPASVRPHARPLRLWKGLRVRTGCLEGLDFLWLEITRSCNLTCAHCYAGSAPSLPVIERMQFRDWCRVMDQARAVGCRSLQFIGGEPTIHPHLGRMIEHARRAGFEECEVYTNAVLLREDLLRLLRRLDVGVAVSFYSPDPEVHDGITGHPGSFERTVEGIRRLVSRKIRLRATVILPRDAAARFDASKRFLRKLGVRSIGSDRVRGIGRGRAFVPGASPAKELCGRCWKGKLCVDSNGKAYPCVFSRFAAVGDVMTDGVRSIVGGRELQRFRREAYLGPEGG
ncbi:MAG: radical SAM protein [Thermoanaerobaculia bacterium]|nr:radical SAM protein [Thermoanaerobaculia bacterium]